MAKFSLPSPVSPRPCPLVSPRVPTFVSPRPCPLVRVPTPVSTTTTTTTDDGGREGEGEGESGSSVDGGDGFSPADGGGSGDTTLLPAALALADPEAAHALRRALVRGSAAADTDAEARALRRALEPFAPAGVGLPPAPRRRVRALRLTGIGGRALQPAAASRRVVPVAGDTTRAASGRRGDTRAATRPGPPVTSPTRCRSCGCRMTTPTPSCRAAGVASASAGALEAQQAAAAAAPQPLPVFMLEAEGEKQQQCFLQQQRGASYSESSAVAHALGGEGNLKPPALDRLAQGTKRKQAAVAMIANLPKHQTPLTQRSTTRSF